MSSVSGFVYSLRSLEVHPVVYTSYSFLLIVDQVATSGMCRNLSIHLLADVHLGGFRSWLS